MRGELDALRAVSFRPYYTDADIWRDDVIHVDGIHVEAFDEVSRLFDLLKASHPTSNIVIQGRPGIGKSHFLGKVRRDITSDGDIFILIQLSSARRFWESVALAYVDSLFHEAQSGRSQIAIILDALGARLGLAEKDRKALVFGELPNGWQGKLRETLHDRLGGRTAQRGTIDAALALCLLNSTDYVDQDMGRALVQGIEIDREDRRAFALSSVPLSPREIVRGFDRVFSFSGLHTLAAVDQLDGLVALAKSTGDNGAQSTLDEIANGLMDFAMDMTSALVVVSCLPVTWTRIEQQAIQAAAHRFSIGLKLQMVPSPSVGEALVAAYLCSAYDRVEFAPPYPTWPIRKGAFDDAQSYSPRELIQLTDEHIRNCRQTGQVIELDQFTARPVAQLGHGAAPPLVGDLDGRFEAHKQQADIASIMDSELVDRALPPLLRAGLEAWIEENDGADVFSIDAPPSRKPPLHARLRQTINADLEDEIHWAFRAIPHKNARSALTRLREAITASGLGEQRKLLILRNEEWSAGQATQQALQECFARGAEAAVISDDELRVFHALSVLQREKPEGLTGWLRARRPASGTALLARVRPTGMRPGPTPPSWPSAPPNGGSPIRSSAQAQPEHAGSASMLPIGRSKQSGDRIFLKLEDLRRHVAIFAGSGSGKTVLIRRIVEECALAGVSSIVLDPNNDLSRLGTPWPAPPESWEEDDAAKARVFHDETDVIIWTPRLSAGRPLAFAPLADLGAVSDDPDEFELALDNSVAMLVPRAGLPASGAKRAQGQAVLKEALRGFVATGQAGLKLFLAYLSDLPEGVGGLEKAAKLGHDMAESLRAATINDPMFGGSGEAIDPGMLLTPGQDKRARISVISLAGLPNDDQRQSFVNQLQMALFAWVKKNPAGERPLGGLFVMDEAQIFAPSSGATPSTASTLALASQARKYGLGLLFATQAPKGLHNQIPGNATTQFFGFLNTLAQIDAAKAMAAAKGGDVSGIAQLRAGEFFVASDGLAFQQLNTPLCLSHHPKSPLTQEEVVKLATTILHGKDAREPA